MSRAVSRLTIDPVPPTIALILWAILLLALLRFDPAREPNSSVALWVTVIWMFIVGSRLPSQWLGWAGGIEVQSLEEGSPLDRTVFSILILLALATLIRRSFNWGGLISRNLCLTAFLLFALVSFFWSDFPLIALKRWFRDLGNYFVILVVLSDPDPLAAVRVVLRRFAFLIIPLSILLVKYFPYLAKHYDSWTGLAEYVGAATSKNMLGNVCLVSGVFFFWDIVTRWSARKERNTKWIIRLNLCLFAMTLWLLNLSRSATSQVCLAIGCVVILAVHSAWGHRHLTLIRVLIPATFCLYLILAFGLDLNGAMVKYLGRNPTLTDRTLIWSAVLKQHTNAIVGTGYESFWLGPRLQRIWQLVGGINEAHNGYLDIYLTLGAIGVFLLLAFLVASYQTIGKKLADSFTFGSLGLAIWAVIVYYNVTEAAFKGGLLWLVLLLGGISLPTLAEEPVKKAVTPAAYGKDSKVRLRFREPVVRMTARQR